MADGPVVEQGKVNTYTIEKSQADSNLNTTSSTKNNPLTILLFADFPKSLIPFRSAVDIPEQILKVAQAAFETIQIANFLSQENKEEENENQSAAA